MVVTGGALPKAVIRGLRGNFFAIRFLATLSKYLCALLAALNKSAAAYQQCCYSIISSYLRSATS